MNTLLKIYKLVMFGILSCFLLNAKCESSTETSPELLVIVKYLLDESDNLRRNRYEPNNDFAAAKCIDKKFETYVYPKNDLDFYKFNIQSGTLKLYISDYETLGSQLNLGMQIYNDQEILIYDFNQRSFDTVNSVLVVNRNLSSNECMIQTCNKLDHYRFIEFNASATKFYIKFYTLDEHLYKGIEQLISLDKTLNPTNQEYFYNVLLQGDFQTCP